jgi:soluble lytic murein transglycosylase-like protein
VEAGAACFEEAGARYGIHPDLLHAISNVESSGNYAAISIPNKNGSRDIGHMQINSAWLPQLNAMGISRDALLNPCTNTYVGAWVLKQNIQKLGYNWNAIGAYNAATPSKRMAYARKIAAELKRGVNKPIQRAARTSRTQSRINTFPPKHAAPEIFVQTVSERREAIEEIIEEPAE